MLLRFPQVYILHEGIDTIYRIYRNLPVNFQVMLLIFIYFKRFMMITFYNLLMIKFMKYRSIIYYEFANSVLLLFLLQL